MYPHDHYLIDVDVEWLVVRKTNKQMCTPDYLTNTYQILVF